MDEFHRFGPVANLDAELYNLAVHGIQHGMARAGSRVAGPPLGRAAEVTMHDEAVILDRLFDLDALTLDEITVLAAPHPRPGHAEVRQFAYGDPCFLGEDARNFLVGAPIGPTHGVEEMQRRVVAVGLHAVA